MREYRFDFRFVPHPDIGDAMLPRMISHVRRRFMYAVHHCQRLCEVELKS